MSDKLTLLGVASNGSVEQWDGLPTVKGILLRWFQGNLSFPDYGYDVYRTRTTDYPGLNFTALAGIIPSLKQYTYHKDLTLSCPQGFSFKTVQGQTALSIIPQNPVTVDFLSHAWYVGGTLAPIAGSDVLVSLYAQGALLEARHLTDTVRVGAWYERGIDRVVLSGQGALWYFSYALVSQLTRWTHMVHLCLPVTDPGYAGGSNWSGSDADEAQRRLPPGVDWSGIYEPIFEAIYPTLKELALGKPAGPVASPGADKTVPTLTLQKDEAVQLAALNPHVARMLGLAWDDPLVPNGLDGRAYGYKVTGRWKGRRLVWKFSAENQRQAMEEWGFDQRQAMEEWGFDFQLSKGRWVHLKNGAAVSLAVGGTLEILWQQELASFIFSMNASQTATWEILDTNGRTLTQGKLPAGKAAEIGIKDSQARGLRLYGPVKDLQLLSAKANFKFIERSDILPMIMAQDPGAPAGPKNLLPEIVSAPGITGQTQASVLQARLYWKLPTPSGEAVGEFDSVFYQVAARQLSDNPDTPDPAIPPFSRKDLLKNGNPIILPLPDPQNGNPCYFTDGPLDIGWRCWWVRGIDIFGRVSAPAAPVEKAIVDNALPSAPSLLLAEYVQGALSDTQQIMAGYSVTGQAWLDSHPGQSGIVVSWAWTPELAHDWPDVDGYRLLVRRPLPVSDPKAKYPSNYPDDLPTWGPVRLEVGPLPAAFRGQVEAVTPGIPQLTLTSVKSLDDQHAECQTDFNLDVGQGALLGLTLNAKPPVIIRGHGQGPNITLTVEHPVGQPPSKGTYACNPGTGKLITLDTDINPAPFSMDPFQKRWVGVLAKDDWRWAVLSSAKGRFLCLGDPPQVGDTLAWYPAYLAVLQDKDFGPVTAPDQPVAYAQVTVLSVRRLKSRALQSLPGTPGTLQGVDCTPPATPVLPSIPSGPYCSQQATRADWYGVSRFTLQWPTTANTNYKVYRAISEAVFDLDRAAYVKTGMNHPFPDNPGNFWPADVLDEILADANRTQIVKTDLSQLDAALATGDDKTIRTAYWDLHSDTQRLIAGRACVEPAYSARNKEPLATGQYTDELDGRSRAHWFYRVSARSLSGLESPKSSPTPPICCPDVVPPAQPLVIMALAAPGKVRLQWQAVPDDDLALYRIYRAADEMSARDVRDMQEVAQLPNPDAVADHPTWREYQDPAAGVRYWYYRIVAEDKSGNRSQASDVLKGRALLTPPEPPVWRTPVRTPTDKPAKVLLSWTVKPVNQPDPQDPSKQVPVDPRLACMLERRQVGAELWTNISGWLPRGVYAFTDAPVPVESAWEYRLRVKDHYGQTAASMPTLTLATEG